MPPELTPDEEYQLYNSDRPAWLRLVATRMAARVASMDDDLLAALWPTLARDYQTALWHALTPRDQARVRALRESATATVAAA